MAVNIFCVHNYIGTSAIHLYVWRVCANVPLPLALAFTLTLLLLSIINWLDNRIFVHFSKYFISCDFFFHFIRKKKNILPKCAVNWLYGEYRNTNYIRFILNEAVAELKHKFRKFYVQIAFAYAVKWITKRSYFDLQ